MQKYIISLCFQHFLFLQTNSSVILSLHEKNIRSWSRRGIYRMGLDCWRKLQKFNLGLGSRIIPYDNDSKEDDNFIKGTGESKNQARTAKRTQRKGYDRYQMRRKNLIDALKNNNMLPDEGLVHTDKMNLWKIRGNAAREQVLLPELGRILCKQITT